MTNTNWLDEYSGQTVDELLALESDHRIDSLVLVFEQALGQKMHRDGTAALTDEERIIVAVEALEREVNNGGYDQFFSNSSAEFVPTIVSALEHIGCSKTAAVTQRAIDAARDGLGLEEYDDAFYETQESIETRLFAFIKAHRHAISLP